MLETDRSIFQCMVMRFGRNVSRKCGCREAVGLVGVGRGHLILQLNGGDEGSTGTGNRMGVQ